MSSSGQTSNLLKQQITNLKKQANKRYNSVARGGSVSRDQSNLVQSSTTHHNAYGNLASSQKNAMVEQQIPVRQSQKMNNSNSNRNGSMPIPTSQKSNS